MLLIPLDITHELCFPVRQIAFRHSRFLAFGMTMPKTPMHENDRLVFWEAYIRLSGQITSMQPESQAHLVKQFTHGDFRFGVFRPNLRYYLAALCFADSIHIHALSMFIGNIRMVRRIYF